MPSTTVPQSSSTTKLDCSALEPSSDETLLAQANQYHRAAVKIFNSHRANEDRQARGGEGTGSEPLSPSLKTAAVAWEGAVAVATQISAASGGRRLEIAFGLHLARACEMLGERAKAWEVASASLAMYEDCTKNDPSALRGFDDASVRPAMVMMAKTLVDIGEYDSSLELLAQIRR